MFSLLFGLWRYLFSKAEYHILILGIDKAGKTVSVGAGGGDLGKPVEALLFQRPPGQGPMCRSTGVTGPSILSWKLSRGPGGLSHAHGLNVVVDKAQGSLASLVNA